jgi:hypothetical protein
MTSPQKKAGFRQGIYEISSTCKEVVGMLRVLQDGRKYRYAKAGSTALVAGKMSHAAQSSAYHINEAILAAVAVGAYQLSLTVTAGAALAANQLRGGYLTINAGTGAGHQYEIDGNTAITASETAIYVSLKDPIRVALDTTSKFNLLHSPWYGTDESADGENFATGVAPMAVTASYYYWAQTGGPAVCLIYGTPAVGSNLILSTNLEGALDVINTTVDVDVPIVGYTTHVAGVNGEYYPVFLKID